MRTWLRRLWDALQSPEHQAQWHLIKHYEERIDDLAAKVAFLVYYYEGPDGEFTFQDGETWRGSDYDYEKPITEKESKS